MVSGLESFKKAFAGYEDCYTVIGGTACDILMSEADLDFRATKDVDMILIIENRFKEFSEILWKYIKEGEYTCGRKIKDEVRTEFFRFTDPKSSKYPKMIELFSKDPGYQLYDEDTVITPLHIEEGVSSLSAIMLNDDYYNFMMDGREVVAGVGVLSAEYLIPLKIRAWVDLTERKNNGIHVDDKNIKKHKYDVFRLYNLVVPERRIKITKTMKEDINIFLEAIDVQDQGLLALQNDIEDVVNDLQKLYIVYIYPHDV